MFYLLMDETDLVTGRHLKKIPQAVEEILDVPEVRPKVVVICITCVDALLGTDLVRVCKKAEERTGVHVVPSYMYALMREGTKPPMTAIRQSVYSLLRPLKKNPHAVNLLGQFAPYDDDTEIYEMFRKVGLTKVREIGRMKTLEEYMEMGEANFNLVLNPESRYAADDLMQRLGMPYIEMNRFYDIQKIQRQYALLGGALGVKFDDAAYYEEASKALEAFRERHPKLTFAIGQTVNANPFELAAALLSYGYAVDRVFANATPADLPFITKIAEMSPDTRFYTSISPTMMNYKLEGEVDITIGKDAAWYYPEAVSVPFFSDVQPFGYRGLIRLLAEMEAALSGKTEE
jgi:nitrogenase molybdenum-cofactor synthesis protein NifE